MTRRIGFTVRAWTPTEREAVFRLVADGTTWPAWSPIGSFRLERQGGAGGESVGAVRVFTTGGVTSREQIVEIKPAESLTYEAISGLPIRNHKAKVTLADHEGGTAITWSEEFDPRFAGSGWLLESFLRRFVQKCADGLATAAAG